LCTPPGGRESRREQCEQTEMPRVVEQGVDAAGLR
jgi:hypothetical protein